MTTSTAARGHRALVEDRKLTVALVGAFLWHGSLLLSGSYRRSYDAYIHMFFGDHYARDWFSTWETRWYTGFTTTSYPPGAHQLIGLFSKLLGLELALVLVQMTAILLLVVGVYRFSRIWVGQDAAGWAALLAAASSSIAEAVHVFGQLPTTLSLGLLLNAMPAAHRWISSGGLANLLAAWSLLAATTAAHHVTTLFGSVFFLGPVVVHALHDRLSARLPDEPAGSPRRLQRRDVSGLVARRIRRVVPALARTGVLGVGALVILVSVVLPYWLWSSSDPITQVPIPHASRDNFLTNRAAGMVFFALPWGALLVALPFALVRGAFSRAWPLAASTALLFLLGTGGTTPIPRLLLGGAFDILTLDRFTIWATIAVLPLAGAAIHSVLWGALSTTVQHWLGRRGAQATVLLFGFAMVAMAMFSANFAAFRPLQPDTIDPEPIAEFMAKDDHDRWRYLTLGFGDQMAIVSASTTATTVDGNYHSARRLPELTSRSVERLEGAKFRGVPGIGSLQQFLGTPSTYNLKFVFSNDVFYDPLLWASGWHRLGTLQNDVVVWEREDIPPLPDVLPTQELPAWQRLLWGTLPMSALVLAGVVLAWTAVGMPVSDTLSRRTAPARRLVLRPVYWVWGAVDRRLLAACASLDFADDTTGHDRTASRLERMRSIMQTAPRRSVRLVALTGLLLLVAVPVVVVARSATGTTPRDELVSYYDDLDFRRFESAWNRLDPVTRPSFAEYRLQLSVTDGLVASYAKLDSIEVADLTVAGDTAVAVVDLDYVTSLSSYEVRAEHTLHRRNGTWHLAPPSFDLATVPDQFAPRPTVDYLAQGRRQVTTEQTLFGDVLDRPRLYTSSAELVLVDGRYSLVGELVNLDVDPADVTISARLLDRAGDVLVEHDATLAVLHKLLPKEATPFRIDFEAIAGSYDIDDPSAGDFDPDAFTPPVLDRAVDRVELSVKAVVSGRDLERPLTAQRLRVEQRSDQSFVLEGELLNNHVVTATVPHVVVSAVRADGTVGWVEHHFGPEAVRSQRSSPFSMHLDLPDPSSATVDVAIDVFGNGIENVEGEIFTGTRAIDLPPETGFDHLRVVVGTFVREPDA